MSDKKELVIEDGVQVKCSCGGYFVAALKPQPVLLHSQPPCAAWLEKDPADFLEHERHLIEKGKR